MDISAEAVAPSSRQVFNFTDSARPVWLGKDDEWVSGGWSRWAALGKQTPSPSCHLCSAGMVRALLRERRMQTGRELSVQLSCQCTYSTSVPHTWGAAWWASLLPLSDCSRLNSALLQCQHTFPLEYRDRRISVTDWAFLAGAGFVCRDCSRPFGIESGFNRTAAHKRSGETPEEDREDRGQSKRRSNIPEDHMFLVQTEQERRNGVSDGGVMIQLKLPYLAVTSACLLISIFIFEGSRNSTNS